MTAHSIQPTLHCTLQTPHLTILFQYLSGLKTELLPARRRADIRWNSGSWSHFHILRKVSRPDLSLDQGLGLRSKSDSVPWDRHNTLWAKIACGMEYLFSSADILWANSLVFISSISPLLLLVELGLLRLGACWWWMLG